MLALGYLGFNTHIREGLEFRFPSDMRALLKPINAKTDHFYDHLDRVKCKLIDQPHHPHTITCIENQRPLAILWGDSHAMSLVPGLLHLQQSHPFGLMVLAAAQCPPVLNVKPYLFRSECDDYSKYDIDLIGKIQPEALIIASTYREPRYFWTNEYFETHFSKTLEQIKRHSPKTKVIIIGPTPRWSDSPQSVFFSKWLRTVKKDPISISQNAYQVLGYDELLSRQAQLHDYQFINLWNIFCKDRQCLTRLGDTAQDFMAVDYGHLSKTGSIYAINHSANTLLNALGILKAH